MSTQEIPRRSFLRLATAAAAGTALVRTVETAAAGPSDPQKPASPTRFQIACMTLPYSQFPLQRALTGIRAAGYQYVAWGTTHREPGDPQTPVMPADAPLQKARDLAKRCRDLGLEPLMMFSMIYPEAANGLEVLTQRLKQAEAAGLPQVLTFGHTEGGSRPVWIERFRKLGPIARDHGVVLVVKQHGGSTGTGAACGEIIHEVNDPGIVLGYDAGNVLDYLHLDPIPDIRKCATRSAVSASRTTATGPRVRIAGLASARSTITSSWARWPSRACACRCAARTSPRRWCLIRGSRKVSTAWPAAPASSWRRSSRGWRAVPGT